MCARNMKVTLAAVVLTLSMPRSSPAGCTNPNLIFLGQVTNFLGQDSGCGGSQHFDVGYRIKNTATGVITYYGVENNVLVPALCAGDYYDCNCALQPPYTKLSTFTPYTINEDSRYSVLWARSIPYISGYNYQCGCSSPCSQNASGQVIMQDYYPNYIDDNAPC